MASYGWGAPSNNELFEPQKKVPSPKSTSEGDLDLVSYANKLQEDAANNALSSMSDDDLLKAYEQAKARESALSAMSDEDLMRAYEEAKAREMSAAPVPETQPPMGTFEYLRKSAESKGVRFDSDSPNWKQNLDATLMALTPFFDKAMRVSRSNEIGDLVKMAKGDFDINDPSIRERYHDSLIPYYSGMESLDDAKKHIQETALRQAVARSEQLQGVQNEISERGTTTMGTIFGKGAEIVGQAGEALVPGGLATKALVSGATEAASRYAEHANSKIGYDENGNPVILDGDSTGKAIREALEGGGKTGAIEFFGGKVLGKVWGATGGKLVGKAAGSTLGQKVAENGIVKGITKITNLLKTPLETLGWAGIPGEVGEEFLDGATDAYFGLDTTDAEEKGTTAGGRFKEFAGDFFKGENLADLAGSMLLMQAIGGGRAYLQERHTNKQLNKIITEEIGGVSENVLNKLSPEEKARIIESHYQGLSAEEAADIINKGAGALDKFMIEKQTEATKSADGRAMLAETNPEAVDAIRAARREGKDISRKMIRDLGLSEKVLGDVESRNKFGDALLEDGRARAAKNLSKMDSQQKMALGETIAQFVDANDKDIKKKVYDQIASEMADASVLDDPYQREQLVMKAVDAVYQKEGLGIKIPDISTKEVVNEARTDETQQKPEQTQPVTPPAGETARPMEAGEAPTEVGGKVKVPKWISDAPPSTSAVGRDGLRIVAFPRNGQSRSSREGDAIVRAMKGLRGVSVKVNAKKSSPEREIFFDKTSGSEFANSGNTKYLRTIARKGTDVEKEWAKKTLSAKVSAIPYFREIIANARNERHTPYEAIKNTPGHEKKKGQWGGGLYEYDVAFAVDGDRYKGRMVVRCDNKGKMFLCDIVDLNDGSAIAKQKVLNEKNRSRASYTSKGETKDSTASMPNIVSNLSSRVNADAVSTPTKPKTVREGKAFVNSNIGKRFTDGKKTYEITGLTKDGEVSVKVTDKIGKSSETTLKLSGTLTNIFGTKKKSAAWSEVKAVDSEQKSPSRTKTTVDDVARLAGKTVPTYLKAMEPSQSGGNIGEDYKIESNFANEVLKMVKGMSESELGEVSASLRKTFYAKGNPMPGGYKPLLDAASYALDAARAGKDSVRLPMPEHLRTRVKTTVENPKTEQNMPKTEIATWKDRAGNEHQIEGYVKSDGSKINIGEEIIVSHSNGIPYKGKVVSIGTKNVVIKTQGGMGGEAELKFPRSELVGKRDTSMGKIESKTEPKKDAKVEPKSETAPSITPAEAMKKLGSLGAMDVDTLTKALAREERAGHTERANMIRVLRDYKRGVGTNPNPQSDESLGGKYRASVEAAKPLDDPAFVAWAKKRGVAPTTQKRNEYDKAMADTLTNRLSRWIKGVSVNTVNFIAPDEGGDVRAAKEVKAESDSKSALGEIAKGKDYGVLHNNTYGEIKYPLGRSGKKGMGFLHIVEHRMNEGASLDEAIDVALKVGIAAEIGTETKNVLNTRHLDYDGVRAIIAIQNGNVIVTGYEIDADENTAAIRRAAKHKPHPHVGSDEVISALRKKLSATENSLSQSTVADKSVRLLHDGERIVGSYNRATGEVKLAKGASVETVLHELGWHAARHWTEVNADSDPKAANLLNQMKEYAESAPKEIKDAVRDVYGDLDADTLLDEIGAARFTKEQSGKIAEALATKEGAAWYQKVLNKVVDFFKNFLTKIGYNRVDLDGVENMSPEVFGDFLADVMMSGKQLGERTAFSMEAPKGLAAKWTNNLSDYKAPIAELEKRVTGSSNNIYYLARTLEGQAQRGKNRAERAIKRVEKILGDKVSPELLAQYMQLKAYEERNAKIERRNGKADASGMTPEDARAIEKTINESGVDEAIFEEAAQILWDLQREGLQARVDAGLLDQETANKWMTDEPHHIPWKDAVDPDSGEYVGRKVGASEFDTAEGRKTAASGDPITWMLQEYQDAMTRAAQNRLRSAIANLTRLNGDVGIIYDGIQTDSKGKRSFIKYPRGGGKAKVLSIPEGVKLESTVKNDGGMKNVLTFKEGGETKYLVLNGSLGEAVAGAVTGRTLSRPPAWISGTMRLYAATATSLSPAFAVRNITADNFDIHNNLVAKYGWVKGEKMYWKVIKGQALMTKQLGLYIKNGDFKLDKDGNITDFQKLVETYEDAGGLIGGMATEGYDATVKKIQADFRAGRNKARSIGKSVATYWTMMQKMSELAPRLAVFKAAMESGMSAKEAAMLSREITVDFNKKGEKTPWFNTLFMFSNSALGANLTQVKHLATKGGLKLAGGLVMYGFAEGMLEALMNGDDDEREKEGLASGEDINEYTRQNSLYIRRGDKVFRVNIHMGPFAYAKYFGNVMARTFSGMISPEKAAKELGLTAAEVAASFTGLGNVSGDALVQTAVPTVLQPFVQMATNKDYAGRAVYRTKFTASKPDSAHGRKSTPEFYHQVASFLNEITGGNEARKGWIDVAPETVKMLTEMVGKNFARDIMETSEVGYKLLSGNAKDLDIRNVPFAGDVVRKQEGNDNRFYENYNRYRDDKYELKNNSELKGNERRAYLKEHPWLYSAGKPGVTRIDNIVKRIEKLRDVEESDRATDERKAEAKATRRKLQARVIEIMTRK